MNYTQKLVNREYNTNHVKLYFIIQKDNPCTVSTKASFFIFHEVVYVSMIAKSSKVDLGIFGIKNLPIVLQVGS